ALYAAMAGGWLLWAARTRARPAALGIQRLVGSAIQALLIHAVARELSHASAEGHVELGAVWPAKDFMTHGVQQPIKPVHSVACAHGVHANDELLAAPAIHHVLVAERATQNRAQPSHHFVARCVTEAAF